MSEAGVAARLRPDYYSGEDLADSERDYYSLLGVGRDASAVEIERAYRRAARATHPDVNPGDSSAAERFNAVTVAYETLRSAEHRASYDRGSSPAGRAIPVTVTRRRPPVGSVAPVQLGGSRPPAEPLGDDLLDVFSVLRRLLTAWPMR